MTFTIGGFYGMYCCINTDVVRTPPSAPLRTPCPRARERPSLPGILAMLPRHARGLPGHPPRRAAPHTMRARARKVIS